MNIVTGMHRSGTSMIARMLAEMNATFGDVSQLLQADKWNKRGYYENQNIIFLNDAILLGDYAPSRKFWTTPAERRSIFLRLIMSIARMRYTLFLCSKRGISKRAAKKKDRIKAFATENSDHVVKDPRFSILIGEWAKVVKIKKVLYCYRHPYEVAASLKIRSKSPFWLSYRFWYFHINEFFTQANNIPTLLVNYNNFFFEDKYLFEIKRLFNYLERPYDEQKAIRLAQTVLDKNLKNISYAGSKMPRYIDNIYRKISYLHEIYGELKPFESARFTILS